MRTFSKITMVSGMDSPATVNRKTGELFLSYEMWPKIPIQQKAFIVFHELGHLALQTTNEFRADDFAIRQIAYNRFPLSGSIKSMLAHLDETIPEHKMRANKMYHLAQALDTNYQPLNYQEMSKALETALNKRPIIETNSFLGFGKKAAARKQEKRDDKQAFKLETIAARAAGRANVAKEGGGLKGLGAGLGSILSSVLSPGGASADPGADPNNLPPAETSTSTYVIIGIVVVVVIAGIIYFIKKAKK